MCVKKYWYSVYVYDIHLCYVICDMCIQLWILTVQWWPMECSWGRPSTFAGYIGPPFRYSCTWQDRRKDVVPRWSKSRHSRPPDTSGLYRPNRRPVCLSSLMARHSGLCLPNGMPIPSSSDATIRRTSPSDSCSAADCSANFCIPECDEYVTYTGENLMVDTYNV